MGRQKTVGDRRPFGVGGGRMSNIKLKPCPFCGGEVELWAIVGKPYPPTYKVDMDKISGESEDVCFVHCSACNANFHKEMRIESFPLDTIKWWNTRKPVGKIVNWLKDRESYFESKAAEYDEQGDEINTDICDEKAVEINYMIAMLEEV